jgi:hypothetical protein
MLSTLLATRESILEGDAPMPMVPVDAGACHIGSGVRTMKKRVAPFLEERFGPAMPATPTSEVPRPPLPASAAEPEARVAMINNAIFQNPMAKVLSTSTPTELLTRGGRRVEKVEPE